MKFISECVYVDGNETNSFSSCSFFTAWVAASELLHVRHGPCEQPERSVLHEPRERPGVPGVGSRLRVGGLGHALAAAGRTAQDRVPRRPAAAAQHWQCG